MTTKTLELSHLLPKTKKEAKEETEDTKISAIGEAAEGFSKHQSLLTDVLGRAGAGSLYAVTATLSGTIATLIVNTVLLPLTDHVLLLFLLTANCAVVVKVIHDWLYDWHAEGRWTPALLYLLHFFFLTLFFCTTNLVLAFFAGLATISPAMTVAAVFVVIFVAFNILLFMSHVSFGLLTHPVDQNKLHLKST